jgi:hypothetical protein
MDTVFSKLSSLLFSEHVGMYSSILSSDPGGQVNPEMRFTGMLGFFDSLTERIFS